MSRQGVKGLSALQTPPNSTRMTQEMIYDLFDAHLEHSCASAITRSVGSTSLTIMDSNSSNNNQNQHNSWLFKFLSEDHSNDHHLLESYFRPNELDYEDPLAILNENPMNLNCLLPTSESTSSTATSYLEHDLKKMEQIEDLSSLTDLFKFTTPTNPLSLNDPFFGHQENYAPLYRCADSGHDSLDFVSFQCPTEYSGPQNHQQWSSFEATTTTTNVTVIQNPTIDESSFGVLNPGPLVHDQELLSQWSAFIESRSIGFLDQHQVGSQIPRIQDSDQFLTQQWSAFIESRFSSGSITSELDRLLSMDHAHLLLGFHDSGIHETPTDQIDPPNPEPNESNDHEYLDQSQIKVTKVKNRSNKKRSSNSNSTKKLVRLTPEQKQAVEEAFQENPRPRSYSDLSVRLGLSKLRTMSCFRYHRVKQKKMQEKEHESEREQKYQNYLTNIKSEICDSDDEDSVVPKNLEDSDFGFSVDQEDPGNLPPIMPSLFSNLISMYLNKLDLYEEGGGDDEGQSQDIEVNNLDCEVSHVASNVILT